MSPARGNGSPPLVWLVTGASSGLGRFIAEAALDAGDTVVATARNRQSLQPLTAQYGNAVIPVSLDVTDAAQTERAVEEALVHAGRIDVLVNNAGRVHIGSVEEVTDADLKALFELHVFGSTRLVRAVLPHMRARGSGTVVQMSTMGSFLITPGFSSYTASKAALEGLSASLAEEVRPFGVRVLIVQPGSHRTEVFSANRASVAAALPDYANITGPTRAFLANADGSQPGDPAKAARTLVELIRSGVPLPLRLPLGADAVANIGQALEAIRRDIDAWSDVARSTAYDPPPSSTHPLTRAE